VQRAAPIRASLSHRALRRAALTLLVLAAPTLHAADADSAKSVAPYVPSPQSVVADMLKLADVGPRDFVIDLGSGDGRIVLTAAKVFGARGFGVDIREDLVEAANQAAVQQGVADRVKFYAQDLFKTDVSKATVLTMYLLPGTVNRLRDKLLAELKPGTRVLSHDYPLTGWMPETYERMDLADKVPISGVTTTFIYLYLVPARVAGHWRVKTPSRFAQRMTVDIKQEINRVSGTARIDGHKMSLADAQLHGERLSFRLRDGRAAFSGSVKGRSIEGLFTSGSKRMHWSATRSRGES